MAVLDERLDADMTALRELADHPSLPAFLAFIGARSASGARRASRASGASGADESERWTLLTAEFWLHALRNRELVPKLAARQQAARGALASVITKLCQQAGIELAAPPEDLASVMLAVDDGLMLQEALDPDAVPGDLRLRTMLLFVPAVTRPPGP